MLVISVIGQRPPILQSIWGKQRLENYDEQFKKVSLVVGLHGHHHSVLCSLGLERLFLQFNGWCGFAIGSVYPRTK